MLADLNDNLDRALESFIISSGMSLCCESVPVTKLKKSRSTLHSIISSGMFVMNSVLSANRKERHSALHSSLSNCCRASPSKLIETFLTRAVWFQGV